MPDYEIIRLVGGPANGREQAWDGGDFLEVVEVPPIRLTSATPAFRALLNTTHTYRRDPVERDLFRWVMG